MTKLILLAALLCGLAACAPVPRPFSAHTETNPLVEDRRVTSSLQIGPVAQYPGLAEAIVHDLAGQDVLATTHDAGARKVLVTASVENGALIWRAATADQKTLASATQPTQGRDLRSLARESTALIIGMLTAEGASPDPNQPHVAVHPVHGPKALQLGALSQAMAVALAGQGVVVGDENPVAVVDGDVRVAPSTGGQDVLQIDWTVRDAKGNALGTISQGSPVPHAVLSGSLAGLAHDIALAGAPGVTDVLRKKLPRALGGL
jgi:hypothetical protein